MDLQPFEVNTETLASTDRVIFMPLKPAELVRQGPCYHASSLINLVSSEQVRGRD